MITLITATPGSGKTLYAIELIDKFLNSDNPRPIFTNIEGLQLDKFVNSDLIKQFPTPDVVDKDPFDWRTCPDGSVVIYDEVQWFFSADGSRGAKVNPIITELTMSRHRGFDIFFITQMPKLLHPTARGLANEHIHFQRSFGSKLVTKYVWQQAVDNPTSKAEQSLAIKSMITLKKKYFSYYKSASVHTHKLRIPKKIIFAVVAPLLLFSVVGYYLIKDGGLLMLSKNDEQALVDDAATEPPQVAADGAATIKLPQQTYKWSTTQAVQSISGCVHTEKDCACFDYEHNLMDLSVAQCLSVIDKRLPFSNKPFSSSSGNSQQAAVSN